MTLPCRRRCIPRTDGRGGGDGGGELNLSEPRLGEVHMLVVDALGSRMSVGEVLVHCPAAHTKVPLLSLERSKLDTSAPLAMAR